jgi:hypothetical protein
MGKQKARTAHQTFVEPIHIKRRGEDEENMTIDVKEFGEIYTNQHELCAR